MLKPNIRQIHFFLLVIVGLSIAHNILAAQKFEPYLSPLQKISQSFSDDKFGRTTMPKGAKLVKTNFNNPECSPQKLADCHAHDVNGVELYFSPYDGLNSKRITIDVRYSGAVRAAGIGKARSMKDVLASATRFVPGLSFVCTAIDKSDRPKGIQTSCTANIPEKMGANVNPNEQDPASIELLFDANGRIKSVMVTRSNFID